MRNTPNNLWFIIFNKMFEITKEQQDITTLRNTPNIF